MGLDTTHDCWHGAYSAFMTWRCRLAQEIGISLQLMDGFCDEVTACLLPERIRRTLPFKWEALKPDVLHVLLNHSDCDGTIENKDCKPLAERLFEIAEQLPAEADLGGHIGNLREKTLTFARGLMDAHEAGEDVGFH